MWNARKKLFDSEPNSFFRVFSYFLAPARGAFWLACVTDG